MRKQLKILLFSSALFTLAGGLFGPLYAVFVKEIGGDLLTAGAAYSAFAIASGILIFFVSKWEDHVKHLEKLVILGYTLGCVGYIGYLLIREPWHLFMVQIIFGFAQAIGSPAYDGLYTKNLDKGKFASEWGLWSSISLIVAGIAAAAGGYLARLYGFQTLFGIMFILSLCGLIVSTLLIKHKKPKKHTPKTRLIPKKFPFH